MPTATELDHMKTFQMSSACLIQGVQEEDLGWDAWGCLSLKPREKNYHQIESRRDSPAKTEN